MPTGYTAFIENKQCNSAKQFLKLCLRNFGVLCKYKDEPLSLDFEPDFTNENENENFLIKKNEDNLEKYKNELKEFDDLSYDEKLSKIKEGCLKQLNFYKKLYDEGAEINARYDDFIEAIEDWNCSEDFKQIKEFAINQCKISKENLNYYGREIIKYQTLIDNIETAKYVVQCDINKYRNLPQYVIDGYRSVQCEIDKYRNAIITKIESCQDCINRIKGQKASNKEFYDRFIKELEKVEF